MLAVPPPATCPTHLQARRVRIMQHMPQEVVAPEVIGHAGVVAQHSVHVTHSRDASKQHRAPGPALGEGSKGEAAVMVAWRGAVCAVQVHAQPGLPKQHMWHMRPEPANPAPTHPPTDWMWRVRSRSCTKTPASHEKMRGVSAASSKRSRCISRPNLQPTACSGSRVFALCTSQRAPFTADMSGLLMSLRGAGVQRRVHWQGAKQVLTAGHCAWKATQCLMGCGQKATLQPRPRHPTSPHSLEVLLAAHRLIPMPEQALHHVLGDCQRRAVQLRDQQVQRAHRILHPAGR